MGKNGIMPKQRMELFSREELDTLHRATLDILATCGVEFPSAKTQAVFREHGFRVEGDKIFITGEQLQKALSTTPHHIRVRARNPKNNLAIGEDDYVLAITINAPNFIDGNGRFTNGSLSVYTDFCKLTQTSDFITPAPHSCCHPSDVPLETAHLDMLQADITHTDRVLLLSCANEKRVLESLDLAAMVFGGMESLKKEPSSLGLINPHSPLKYAYDQSEALTAIAAHNQPLTITNMMLLGTSAPIDLPTAMVVSNAEILAGVVLSQLVCPGVGVIYGTTSCPMDMKSMVSILGAPETLILSRATLALAEYYGLPCRTGGSLTDSHLPDAQAMIDSTLVMQNALAGGVHYVLHAFGMMSSYMAASMEKFVLDEEMIRMALASLEIPSIHSEMINMDLIKRVASRGNYIDQDETLESYGDIFRSQFLNRLASGQWEAQGGKSAFDAAKAQVQKRIASWEKPTIDSKLENEIVAYVKSHKG
jgi:trimethylamine--corrinoid protein Co-methyltransferase